MQRRSIVASVAELRYLADRVMEEAVFVPDTVLRAFRLTLEARETMSRYYQSVTQGKDRIGDETHAFFNILLREIYHDLKGPKKITRHQRSDSGTACHVQCSNTFDCLLQDKSEHCNDLAANMHHELSITLATKPIEVGNESIEHVVLRQPPDAENDGLEVHINICTYVMVCVRSLGCPCWH